ncbi:helix-turn-helix domain-containing protein [Nocardioides hankookensis]|uniref:Helix-turn-helix domain-containing protein n=1 Tax=Nocardioides hankookensis TaxID=443157 RepID=A0ABW1LMU5_9ACTN
MKDPLPQFAGTASCRPTAAQREELIAFVAAGYRNGLSLRELAELTDRTQTAVRRALDQAGVRRRDVGAPVVMNPVAVGQDKSAALDE